jgi:hypothetical protein
LAQRSSRKRRKERQRATGPAEARNGAAAEPEATPLEPMARGYARGREKDAAARAALKPLAPGERPAAVTVGAIVAAVLAVANLVALVLGFDPGEPSKAITTVLGLAILVAVAVGMWRARYWAVLGMQTLLALTMIASSLALLRASNLAGVALAVGLVGGSGALFWFLIKAMARIQMPERPGADR